MAAGTQVLFIGLDAAEPALLERWAASGDMPALRSLMERGLRGDVPNYRGFGDGAYWPSFYSALNPGAHGRYFVRQLRQGSYETFSYLEDRDFAARPFWAALSEAGKRVAVIDMVRAPLTAGLNGVHIAEWMTHARAGSPRSWPPEEIERVISRYGDDPCHGETDARGRGPAEFRALRDDLMARIAAKTRLCRDYLAGARWDLFIAVFGEPHDVGHACWHIHDPGSHWHDAALARAVGDPLLAVYRALDRAIGELVEAAGAQAQVVLLAGPGMGPNDNASHLLDEILRRLESDSPRPGAPAVRRRPLPALYRALVGPDMRRRIRGAAARAGVELTMDDRSRRKCFVLPNSESAGAIRINLAGREPRGRVRPGPEYDSLCESLRTELAAVVNADTGEPLVSEVVRVDTVCSGERLHDLPDLMAIWRRAGPVTRVASDRIGEIRRPYPGMRTGDHNFDGTFVAAGPGVRTDRLAAPVAVTALAPSLAALLGVRLPEAESPPLVELGGAAAPPAP